MMSDSHVFMIILDVVTVIYLAWSMGSIHAHLRHDRATQQQFLREALLPLQESSERIAQMVRELHNR